ncbi:MAG: hypothetical protein ACK5RO_04700 [Pseudobdellovibrionaceae bacterium]
MNQKVVITSLDTQLGKLQVVRDDLLPGGTKQRAALPWLKELSAFGFKNFVYASPFCGYAQVALAIACSELNLNCTLFCERDKRQKQHSFHPFSLKAQQYGATLFMCESLEEAQQKANVFSPTSDSTTYHIPLGFNSNRFRSILEEELSYQWQEILRLHPETESVWLTVGSGTLASVMDRILPSHIHLNCVNVNILSAGDERLKKLTTLKRVEMLTAPMSFHQEANKKPNLPSNVFYDAKVWQFAYQAAGNGHIWWNVGP